jgi:hypothetical protein
MCLVVWWLKSHHNYSKRYLFFTPAGGINAVVLWWLKSHHTTERQGVWLGGVVVFFQRYNIFKHKLHLTTPLKAIKTCFLLKKTQATSPPKKTELTTFLELPYLCFYF